jgi:four helix bundle suffix protein
MKSMLSTKATYAEIAANGALALIVVVAKLLDHQMASQARAFENEGGFTERLYRIRSEKRRRGPSGPERGRDRPQGSRP